MSIRAYKIKKIELAETETFNVTHASDALWDSLALHSQLNDDYCGYICLDRENVEQAMEDAADNPELIKELAEVLADFEPNQEYIEYRCY